MECPPKRAPVEASFLHPNPKVHGILWTRRAPHHRRGLRREVGSACRGALEARSHSPKRRRTPRFLPAARCRGSWAGTLAMDLRVKAPSAPAAVPGSASCGLHTLAGVAELVDAEVSKTSGSNPLWVRVPLPACFGAQRVTSMSRRVVHSQNAPVWTHFGHILGRKKRPAGAAAPGLPPPVSSPPAP